MRCYLKFFSALVLTWVGVCSSGLGASYTLKWQISNNGSAPLYGASIGNSYVNGSSGAANGMGSFPAIWTNGVEVDPPVLWSALVILFASVEVT